jgi:YihY family inner membrane protein
VALERLRTVVTTTVGIVRDRQVEFMAAAIAYYALVSLFPLMLLALAVASLIGGQELADTLITTMGDALSPVAQDVVYDTLVSASGRSSATLFGIVVLTWSGLRLFRGLDIAFAVIYDTAARKSFLERSTDAAVVLLGVGLGVVAVTGLNVATAFASLVVGTTVGAVGIFVVGLVFFPVYYLVPDVDMPPAEALPGTLFTAVGWTTLGRIYGLYTSIAGSFDLYGAVGAVLLLVTWFYVGALLLLVGAILNVVLSERGSDRQLQHPPHRQNR